MNDSEKKLEATLSRALLLKEEGKTLPEILALSPEEEKEIIKEIFEAAACLEAKKDEINPSSEILRKILFNLPDQGEGEAKRINLNIKGRVFFGLNFIKESLMTQKLKIAIPVLAVLVLVAAGAYIYFGNQAGTISDAENEIAAALDRELAQEVALAEKSDADLDVALADEQIINEFNQTYDDSQL